MKKAQFDIYNSVSTSVSRMMTEQYSTSFSLAIRLLPGEVRKNIYNIYGFVRLADEIVDTFHRQDKALLLRRLREELNVSIDQKLSTNPVIHSFVQTYEQYNIGYTLVEAFLESMERDLHQIRYDREAYEQYIFGSADAVGLMCLKVFVGGDILEYERLKHSAAKLGSAFQKVNFLRDVKDDFEKLNRTYFPDVNLNNFTAHDKSAIIQEIYNDFREALAGIRQLPKPVRPGVYLAYLYFYQLLKKLEMTPPAEIMRRRISVNPLQKMALFAQSYFANTTSLK